MYGHYYAGYQPDPLLEYHLDRLISAHLADLPPDACVLDVGCGAGGFLRAAKRSGLNAVGLDVSSDAAEICRRDGLSAQAGDFLTYGEPASYDAITMWDVLEHLRDPIAFLRRIDLLLRPGGVFLSKTPTFGALSVALADRVPRLRGVLLGAPGHVQYYTPHSLQTLVERGGLVVEREEAMPDGIRTTPSGGNVKRKAARRIRAAIAKASGDSNLLLVARKPA